MTTFDDRDKNFENKFAYDEELSFKVNARCNKLLGLWAAAKLGRSGTDADQYAKDVVASDFVSNGDGDVIDKLLKDFGKAGVAITEKEIRAEYARLLPQARQQIMGE